MKSKNLLNTNWMEFITPSELAEKLFSSALTICEGFICLPEIIALNSIKIIEIRAVIAGRIQFRYIFFLKKDRKLKKNWYKPIVVNITIYW